MQIQPCIAVVYVCMYVLRTCEKAMTFLYKMHIYAVLIYKFTHILHLNIHMYLYISLKLRCQMFGKM